MRLKHFLKNNFLIILILLFFLITRLYKITEVPSSVYWDEASIGYNAYSVLKTGRDEWGEFLPLHFRAFGEFKLPVYIYSVMVSESIFGLTPLAVRLPSVIYGLLSVLGLFILIKKLTGNKSIALFSSFLFSVSPWFFIFSRTGYEAVSGLAFFIYALYFYILSFEKKRNLLISVLLSILSVYSYNSFRILVPVFLVPGLIYFVLRNKNKGIYILIVSIGILLLSILPIYRLYSKDFGLNRLKTVGESQNIVKNYFSHFSFDFLFVGGDTNPRSQTPGSSQLFIIDLPFLLLGVVYILRQKKIKYYLVFDALLLSIIPAAITRESPHALRSILASAVFPVISAFGIYYFLEFFKKRNKYLSIFIVFFYLLFFGNYFYKYITKYNFLTSKDWQYPYKEIFMEKKGGIISDEYGQPYIFALFYNKVEPKLFWETRQLNPVFDWGFSTVKSFGDYEFIKDGK